MALTIKGLLYDEGYTIPGARQLLKGEQRKKEAELPLCADTTPTGRRQQIERIRQDLQELLAVLSGPAQTLPPEVLRRPRVERTADRQSGSLFDFRTAAEGTEE